MRRGWHRNLLAAEIGRVQTSAVRAQAELEAEMAASRWNGEELADVVSEVHYAMPDSHT